MADKWQQVKISLQQQCSLNDLFGLIGVQGTFFSSSFDSDLHLKLWTCHPNFDCHSKSQGDPRGGSTPLPHSTLLPVRNNVPWLPQEVIQLIRKKNYHFRKAHRSGNRDDYMKLKQIRNGAVAELKLAKRRFFTNIHPYNQWEFWKIVKSLTWKRIPFQLCVVKTLLQTTNPE